MRFKMIFLSLLAAALLLAGCGNIVDREKNLVDDDEINKGIAELPLPVQMPEGEIELSSNSADPDYLPDDAEYYFTKRQNYAVPEMAHFMADDLPTNLLWPGAILDSASFVDGTSMSMTSPDVVRAPLTISTDANYAGGNVSVLIENPNEVSVAEAVNDLITQQGAVNTNKYTRYSYSRFDTSSEFEIKIKTTVGFKTPVVKAKFSALFNKANSAKATKVIVEFTQCYFTVRPALLNKASDFFNLEETSWSEIMDALPEDAASPVFVSSIDYGRSIIAVIETDEKFSSIEAGINAFASYLGGSAELDVSTKVQNMAAKSSITALAIGGNGDVSDAYTSFEGIKNWINTAGGIQFSKPIRFSLRYLFDPTSAAPARFVTGGVFYGKDSRWQQFTPSSSYIDGKATYDSETGNLWVDGVWLGGGLVDLIGDYSIRFYMRGGSAYRVKGNVTDLGSATGYFIRWNDGDLEKKNIGELTTSLSAESGDLKIVNLDDATIQGLFFERRIR